VSLLELRTAVAKGDDGVFVITLEGDLDLAAAPVVGECVATVLDAGATTIALALGGVRFIDSSGLAALVDVGPAVGAEAGPRPPVDDRPRPDLPHRVT
jgi:anti-anti-sigma factor